MADAGGNVVLTDDAHASGRFLVLLSTVFALFHLRIAPHARCVADCG